jgi:hypothetical protein
MHIMSFKKIAITVILFIGFFVLAMNMPQAFEKQTIKTAGQQPAVKQQQVKPRTMMKTPVNEIKTPQGTPEGAKIEDNRLQLKEGHAARRLSKNKAIIYNKKGGGGTGTVTCDPCSGEGSCTISVSEGKVYCASSCSGGCIMIVEIPSAERMKRMK